MLHFGELDFDFDFEGDFEGLEPNVLATGERDFDFGNDVELGGYGLEMTGLGADEAAGVGGDIHFEAGYSVYTG